MKRTLKIISIFIILITALSLYSFIVRHVTLGGDKMGPLSEPLEYFSTFPKTTYEVLTSNELKGIPATYLVKDSTFEEVNNLDYNLYGINSFYNSEKNRWDIKLFNFKNDSVIHEWNLLEEYGFSDEGRKFNTARPMHSLMLPERELIVNCNYSNNLYKLDKNSEVIWHNTKKCFHHSLNLDVDSNIWACTEDDRIFELQNKRRKGLYLDNFITKIDNETGEILFDKSVSEILIENGFRNFVYGFSNQTEPTSDTDPLHLNDIQPVLKNGPFWNVDDVFMSLRNKSLVIHYRPETNKIIRLIHGPFLFQHDVDILSDHEIAIFNNNTTTIGNFDYDDEVAAVDKTGSDELLYSEIMIYNYKDSTYRTFLKEQFNEENIYTRTEGLFEILSTGDVYIENHNEGELYIINEDELVLKKHFATSVEDMVHMPTWIRIYKNIEF